MGPGHRDGLWLGQTKGRGAVRVAVLVWQLLRAVTMSASRMNAFTPQQVHLPISLAYHWWSPRAPPMASKHPVSPAVLGKGSLALQ